MDRESFTLIQRLSQQIKKPIAIFDLETTGLLHDPIVGIVELAILTITENTIIPFQTLINPGIAIPSAVSRIHGIYDSDVAQHAAFEQHIGQIQTMLNQHVITGFNSKSFDIKVIQHNLVRYNAAHIEPNHHLDVRQLWVKQSGSRSGKLAELASLYQVEIGEQHRAMGDVLTTARLLEAMIWQHGADFVMNNIQGFNHKPIIAPKLTSPTIQKEPLVAKTITANTMTSSATDPKEPSKAEIIRQEVLNHLDYFERLLRKNYGFIANRSDCTIKAVEMQVSTLFLANKLPLEKVLNPTEQQLIESYLEQAVASVDSLDKVKPIKQALDRLTQTDVDYVQLYIALERIYGKSYKK